MNEERAEKLLTDITGQSHSVTSVKQAHGGCISEAWVIGTLHDSYFLKKCHLEQYEMFKAEAEGLKELSKCKSLKIPSVLGLYETTNSGYLLLEALNLESHNSASQKKLGLGLAEMHRITESKHGFHQSNFIGSTPQINHKCSLWPDFFSNCRLMPQAYMTGNDEIESKSEELSQKIPQFFKDYTPLPSLLHGDLWGGNTSRIGDDTPVIFDPAVYYGDRETDLAFTEFFGGFSKDFYDSYNQSFALHEGYQIRKYLYQLYHSLNHLNLFGNTYLGRSLELLNYLNKVEY